MDASQDEYSARTDKPRRNQRWLQFLEEELKRRVGWADEAISPFARKSHPHEMPAEISRAA